METVVPSILPIRLKDLGTPNWLIGVIITSGPSILNMTVSPWISFKSDRLRSKWGRRIPFIILTLPFLCLFLCMLGWSENITRIIQHWLPVMRGYAPATVTISLIAVFMMLFQFFNQFVNSVFWYLFNDVVPPQFLGRFMGAFRFVGISSGVLYNWIVFKYAGTHMREIFTAVALLYFIGLGLMCFLVKEGKYPPIEESSNAQMRKLDGLKTFFKESFTHKFYLYRFLSMGIAQIGWSISGFSIFFSIEMGLNYDQIGKLNAVSSVVAMFAVIFMAVFVDRWHPLRIFTYSAIFGMINISWIWLFVTLPGNYYFWLAIFGGIIGAFHSALNQTAELPCAMRTFPQSRFGQFCAAQGMVRSLTSSVSGIIAGFFIDLIKRFFFHGSDFAYRFIFAWGLVFSAISLVFSILFYIEWNRLGGDKHFHPPASWTPNGVEEMPITPTVGPQSRWLKVSFYFFDGIMLFPVVCMPVIAWVMRAQSQMFAAKCYLIILLPLFSIAWYLWRCLKKNIIRDMDAARNKKPLCNGIPHHGILVLVGSKMFILLGAWIMQIIIAIRMNLQGGSVAFGAGQLVTNLMLIGGIWLICRIERGYSITIDEKTP